VRELNGKSNAFRPLDPQMVHRCSEQRPHAAESFDDDEHTDLLDVGQTAANGVGRSTERRPDHLSLELESGFNMSMKGAISRPISGDLRSAK